MVHFAGQRPTQESIDAGYEFDNVCDCIAGLSAHQFRCSIRYPAQLSWQDVYRVKEDSPQGEAVDLYVKFKIGSEGSCLYVCSFHKSGVSS